MRLYKLKIEGFRKIISAEITFGDATFLIGENNVGKSTVLSAIEYLLTTKILTRINLQNQRILFLVKKNIQMKLY